ncbi:unnamed protein product [Moneuplotes crassus]|uniref:Uncharacterized protein n=1 Tax=Euplotes crassus TaxID=5936 RepID=A0AAD1Y877_EUPCR|nr:unnamed protein product [Moneuplotes crassus]
MEQNQDTNDMHPDDKKMIIDSVDDTVREIYNEFKTKDSKAVSKDPMDHKIQLRPLIEKLTATLDNPEITEEVLQRQLEDFGIRNKGKRAKLKNVILRKTQVFNLNTRFPYFTKEQGDYFDYAVNHEDIKQEGNQTTNVNSSNQLIRELSNGETDHKLEKLQKWLEAKFKDELTNDPIFFNEWEFDHAMKDFCVNPKPKNAGQVQTKKATPCTFSREDLKEEAKIKIEQEDFYHSNISVENYKGSEKVGLSEIPMTEGARAYKSNWKRSDLVEKRVIRGLCDVAKDFFNDVVRSAKATNNEKKLKVWINLVGSCFPELYKTSKLKILGQICVNCMGWKFTEKINSFKIFNTSERKKLIKYGKEFRTQRNSSKVKERKILLNHPIIKIGKLLYESSLDYKNAFWKHINNHKKTEINDTKAFKELHARVITKVSFLDCQGDLFSFNLS